MLTNKKEEKERTSGGSKDTRKEVRKPVKRWVTGASVGAL
jgi:hypothetical protein